MILLAFDTETNGFRCNQMIAWGCVLWDVDKNIKIHQCDCYVQFCLRNSARHGGKEGLQALDIHNIKDFERKEKNEVVTPIAFEGCGSAKCCGVWSGPAIKKHICELFTLATHIIAHNICYDLKVLIQTKIITEPYAEQGKLFWDTMYEENWARKGLAKTYKAVCDKVFDESKHHGAWYDAECCAEIAMTTKYFVDVSLADMKRVFRKCIGSEPKTRDDFNMMISAIRYPCYLADIDWAGSLQFVDWSWDSEEPDDDASQHSSVN